MIERFVNLEDAAFEITLNQGFGPAWCAKRRARGIRGEVPLLLIDRTVLR